MSDVLKTGGPAFPTGDSHYSGEYECLSKRDYFAAAALQGLISRPETYSSREALASEAYLFADAMLEARRV
jgi:hypothetical protein